MSADNWSACPRCRYLEELRIADLQRRAQEGYGVLPVKEYELLRAQASEPINESWLVTFREYYEVYGAEQGQINVRYSGECVTCGLAAGFSHEEVFYP